MKICFIINSSQLKLKPSVIRMSTKSLLDIVNNQSNSLIENESILDIEFKETSFEKEFEAVKKCFSEIVLNNKTLKETIKKHHDSSIKDLDALKNYKSKCQNEKQDELKKFAKNITKNIHKRANNIKSLKLDLLEDNNSFILKLEELSLTQVSERNNAIRMNRELNNLNNQKEYVEKQLASSINFFTIFFDFGRYNKQLQLNEINEKLNEMKNKMSVKEMTKFIEKIKKLEDSIIKTLFTFKNYKTFLVSVELISDELLMIDFSENTDLIDYFHEACSFHLKILAELS